jgi:ZIP family zinc transporter
MNEQLVYVIAFSGITAIATGLGIIPLLFTKDIPKKMLGTGNAVAAGLMVAASFGLLFEGFGVQVNNSVLLAVLGVFAGLVFIVASHRLIERNENLSLKNLSTANARQALLIVGVMTLHSFAEGIGVGVAFGDGQQFGTFISTAIAVHNIPEGLAIALVLIPMGVKKWKAALWAIFSSLPQPLIAVPAFLFVEVFRPFLPFGLGLAAGAMIWMAVSELIPEANEEIGHENTALVFTIAVGVMMAFQAVIG